MRQAGDLKRALDCVLDSPAVTAAVMVVLLAMPVMASTGAGGTELREAPRFEAYHAPTDGLYNYQMRCWQHGRLMSEQFLFELPTDRFPMTESGSDRDGLPVYMVGKRACHLPRAQRHRARRRTAPLNVAKRL